MRQTSSSLLCPFDDGDFLGRQAVEFIDELIDPPIRRLDLPLKRRLAVR
jgi:hypothetical protein